MTAKTLPIRFTVRVYGFLLNAKQELLLCEEQIGDLKFIKLPGGGLEFGEGTRECLEREFKEESGIEIFCGNLIYVSDFYIQSAIDPQEQVIGIYYEVKPKNTLTEADLPEIKTEFRGKPHTIRHIWAPLKMFTADVFTFEMDKVAFGKFWEYPV